MYKDGGSASGEVAPAAAPLEVLADVRIWRSRQRLVFASPLKPGTQYTLPLILTSFDARNAVLANEDGEVASCCQDSVSDSRDRVSIWVDAPAGDAPLYLYFLEEPTRGGQDYPASARPALAASLPEYVLPVAEFFRDGMLELLQRWTHRSEVASNAYSTQVAVQSWEDQTFLSSMPRPPCGGQILFLDPSLGYQTLARSPAVPMDDTVGCIHLRAFFYDDGEERTALGHWMGIESKLGSAAVGLAFGMDGCYSILADAVPTGASGSYYPWLRSTKDRSAGWHLFEIFLVDAQAKFFIDSDFVGSMGVQTQSVSEEVCLVSRCGGLGIWAGVELFHTPAGRQAWEIACRSLQHGDRVPWRCLTEEGRWQADCQGVMRDVAFRAGLFCRITSVLQDLMSSFAHCLPQYTYQKGMHDYLGKNFQVVEVNTDGMIQLRIPEREGKDIWWFPPCAAAITIMRQEESAPAEELVSPLIVQENSPPEPEPVVAMQSQDIVAPVGLLIVPPPPPPQMIGGLAIDCWTIPGESDLQQVERVVGVFMEAIVASGIVVPTNVRRIGRCQLPSDKGCFVYNFGTRKLHVSTRANEQGRLLLVVRCGGGFIDFVQFCRRHGGTENLCMTKATAERSQGGTGIIRFTAVLSQRTVRAVPGRPQTAS